MFEQIYSILELYFRHPIAALFELFVVKAADVSKDGPMADSDDEKQSAWIAFGMLTVFAVIVIAVGIVVFLICSGTASYEGV